MRQLKPSLTVFLTAACLFVPVLILVWIWAPEFRHFYVRTERIENTTLQMSRFSPSDSVLEEISSYRLLSIKWRDHDQLIASAEELLHGSVNVPGYPRLHIQLPFAPADLERGSDLWQQQFSSLAVPRILLDAYRLTGREDFWVAARESILAWDRYDRGALIDRGALWDDHALAARTQTLAEFWLLYRHRSDYRNEVARTIFDFAARTGERLSRPDWFTFATNHGVMENIGLWHLCIAFPYLPHVQRYKQIAFTRLHEQMGFYIDQEGVILEHSLGYHQFGLRLIGIAMRYATILQLGVPSEWISKYLAAKTFYGEIQRPDGTLPRLGDTGDDNEGTDVTQINSAGAAAPLQATQPHKPKMSFQLYPVAGYAVLWDGLSQWPDEQHLSQAVLAWSNYTGHGHKHADELSVIFWGGGKEWWTNAGYWPYANADRHHAECWEGSDAPHLADEPCQSSRESSLISAFHDNDLSVVELKREGPGNIVVRRQFLKLGNGIWIVVDNAFSVSQKTLQTIWTTEPDVELKRGPSSSSFSLYAARTKQCLHAFFLGPAIMSTRVLHGSHQPFAGWVSSSLNRNPEATEAIVTEQPAANGWAVSIWDVDWRGSHLLSRLSGTPQIRNWRNGGEWRISIPLDTGVKEISRLGNTITIAGSKDGKGLKKVVLLRSPDVNSQRAELRNKFEEVAHHYPVFRELYRYRLRMTYAILLAVGFEEVFLIVISQRSTRSIRVLRFVLLIAWLGCWGWLRFFYFIPG